MSDPVAVHSFLSHMRTGLAAAPIGDGPVPRRRRVDVDVEVNADPTRTASAHVELYGPADVAGLDPDVVVRTDPAAGAADVEPNYFPAVELDAPDLPWRFSPVRGTDGCLLPWLTLVVLGESEFTRTDAAPGRLPAIVVVDPAATLPSSSQRWAWAHVQVADRIAAGSDVVATLEAEPQRAVSRLLCPRKLAPLTRYWAFVVPAFEAGRLAGLGRTPETDGATPSWTASSVPGLELPVYYEWAFRTGRGGDFESLVRRLAPRRLDERVGTRPMHVGEQPYSVPALSSPVALDGALRHLSVPIPPVPDPAAFRARLGQVLDAPADLAVGQPAAVRAVAPPIYGMWHAAQFRVRTPETAWLTALNLDPRRRAAAGLGAQVIRHKQEQLMAEAWRQVGEIERANDALRRAQLGRAASDRVWRRTFAALGTDALIAVTGPVQARVRRRAGTATVAGAVADARLPNAALQPAFRRVASPRAPTGRRLHIDRAPRLLTRLDQGEIAAAGPAPERPAGMHHIDDVARRELPSVVPPRISAVAPWWRRAATRTTDFLTAGRVAELPDRPDFRVTRPGTHQPTGGVTLPPGAEAAAFKTAAARVQARIGLDPAPEHVAPPVDLTATRTDVLAGLDPSTTVPHRVLGTIRPIRTVRPPVAPSPEDPLEPIMAAPEFRYPMYEPLRDLSPEHLLPGLEHVPPDTLALVRTNRAVVEAYLVGLNHEMSRELLWRGFPTDQRGTYFQCFFDAADDDITALHTWTPTSDLGDHEARPAMVDEPLVLLIRGELLRRYPTAVIYAVKARWDAAQRRRDLDESAVMVPLFRGTLPVDVTFLGFDLTPEAARGSDDPNADQGWFFVIQEQPTEPRFGFDAASGAVTTAPTGWSDLSWGHFAADDAAFAALANLDLDRDPPHWPWPFDGTGDPPRRWRSRAADMAVATLQQPVRVAVHASRMLPEA